MRSNDAGGKSWTRTSQQTVVDARIAVESSEEFLD